MKLILKSFLCFFRDDGPLLAGSIAYFFLMSLVPFCLLLVTIFGYVLGDNVAFYAFFSARLMRFFPAATSNISRELTAVVTYQKIGIVTFIVYVFFSYQFYLVLKNAAQVIFRERRKRSFLNSVVRSIFIVTLLAAFVIISFVATSVIHMLKPAVAALTGLSIGIVTGFLIRFVIPVLLEIVMTTTLYTLLPVQRTALADAFRGGLFTTVFLEVARHLFTIYVVTTAPQFGAVYGSLSSFVIFLLWLYYSACIFLIGAELVSLLRGTRGESA